MTEDRANARLGLGFEKVKKRVHGVGQRFPPRWNVARASEVHRMPPVTGKRSRAQQTRADRRLK